MDYSYTITCEFLGAAHQYPVTIPYSDVDHVYTLALKYAQKYALGADFAEDASQSFGTCWLSDLRENKSWAKHCLESEAYLKRCAANYVKHALAAMRQRNYRETGLADSSDDQAVSYGEISADPRDQVANPAIRKELRALLTAAVNRLQPRPREIFIRRHQYEESVTAIAEALGCTRNAISVSLSASRLQIAKYLADAGHKEADIRDYLYEMLKPDW